MLPRGPAFARRIPRTLTARWQASWKCLPPKPTDSVPVHSGQDFGKCTGKPSCTTKPDATYAAAAL